jgi:hypothetical protein
MMNFAVKFSSPIVSIGVGQITVTVSSGSMPTKKSLTPFNSTSYTLVLQATSVGNFSVSVLENAVVNSNSEGNLASPVYNARFSTGSSYLQFVLFQ